MSDDEAVTGAPSETLLLAEHLRLALDAAGFGTWRWDLASGTTTWDQQMERLFGLEPGTFDGTYDAWKALVHPDDWAEVRSTLEDALSRRGSYQLTHRVKLPDGGTRWIEGSGRVTIDDDGTVTGTVGCCCDISARTESDLERDRLSELAVAALSRERLQRERLELVSAVNLALENAEGLQDLMRAVTATVVPRFADWCGLHVIDGPRDTVPVVEIAHRDPTMVRYARELHARYPFDPDAESGVAAVIRTNLPEFHPHIDERAIAAADLPPDQAKIVEDLALRSAITVPLTKRSRAYGAMQFVMTHDHRDFTGEDVALAQVIAARIAATLDNRRLRQERARTAQTDAVLARLGRRLAASTTEQEVLEVIMDEAPQVLEAQRSAIGLIRDARSLQMFGHHDDVLVLDDAADVAEALQRADTVLRDAVERGPVGARVVSPLYDDLHHPMGVLILEWDDPRPFDDEDLNTVETLTRLCGQAIVRSQLAGHTTSMAALGAEMAAARTTAEVSQLVRRHANEVLHAAVANVRILEGDHAVLVAALPSELPPDVARRFDHISLDLDLPLSTAVRENRTIWLRDLGAYRTHFPEAAAAAEAAGLEATAVIPLHHSDGTVVGAVALAWSAPMAFDRRFRSRVATLCDVAGQTLERVRLYEAEHAVVTSMQRRLLAPLPEVDGVDLLARYEPAASAVGMGGDWYEATPLGDGSVVAVIGDVVGHGVEAVAAMAQIQNLLAGLIRAGTPPRDVLADANSMLSGPDEIYATALLLHIDPAAGRLGYVSAGHPWPLLRQPDGRIQPLNENQHPMIGLNVLPHDLVYVPFPPGTALLTYTDGLIERRGEPVVESIGRLAGHLAQLDLSDLGPSLDHLIDSVRRDGGPARPTNDDVAVLLIHASGEGDVDRSPR
ncbi:MAG: Serine/threonine protein kinase [Ilumatobacteraceae bacterium]|nr:Serine/threonine protein kinase [Ilumatobacteraceae bacterium]